MTQFSDPLDEAAHRQAEQVELAVEEARRAAATTRPYIGECHNCGDPLPEPQRFCDQECAEELDYVEARQRANGSPR